MPGATQLAVHPRQIDIGTRRGGSLRPGYRKRRASTSLSSSARAISHVTPAAAARLMYSPIAPFDTPVDAEIWRWLRPRSPEPVDEESLELFCMG